MNCQPQSSYSAKISFKNRGDSRSRSWQEEAKRERFHQEQTHTTRNIKRSLSDRSKEISDKNMNLHKESILEIITTQVNIQDTVI